MSEVASAIRTVPHVVIAIVATDEAKNIVGCLGSLDGSIYREFSVVICENGGHDAFDRDVREMAKVPGMVEADAEAEERLGGAEGRRFYLGADRRVVTVLRSRENRGYSGGVNFCIAAAGTNWDFIWVLNPDTFPEADALGALVRRQAEGGYGIVGSKIVFVADGRVQLWGGMRYWPLFGRSPSLGNGQPADLTPDAREVEAELEIVAGTSMFVSKDYIKTIGVMDEDFFVYYEDAEWSLRRGPFRLGYAHELGRSSCGRLDLRLRGTASQAVALQHLPLREESGHHRQKAISRGLAPVRGRCAIADLGISGPLSLLAVLQDWRRGVVGRRERGNGNARIHAGHPGTGHKGLFATRRLRRGASSPPENCRSPGKVDLFWLEHEKEGSFWQKPCFPPEHTSMREAALKREKGQR